MGSFVKMAPILALPDREAERMVPQLTGNRAGIQRMSFSWQPDVLQHDRSWRISSSEDRRDWSFVGVPFPADRPASRQNMPVRVVVRTFFDGPALLAAHEAAVSGAQNSSAVAAYSPPPATFRSSPG